MNKVKINFIIAPLPFLGDPKRNPALGVMYLAAIAEQAGYPTVITDLRDKNIEDCLALIPESDVYAFSATTPEYHYCRKIARQLKARSKESLIIIGGVHATVCSLDIDSSFDVVAIGGGESAITEILSDFQNGKCLRFYRGQMVDDLSLLPFPARHLLPRESFVSYGLVEQNKAATSIMASRGCVFNCAFCTSKVMWHQRCRYRSVENVINEIKELIEKYGIKQLRFQDDALAINRKWIFEFCKAIQPLHIVWRANARVENSSEDIISAMRDAGCDELCYGIESFEQDVLDKSNKKMKVVDAVTCLKNARKLNIKTRIFLIIGLPGQDKSVAKNMIDFIKDTQPSGVDLSTFVPFPGSDIYHNPSKYGIKFKEGAGFDDYVMTRGLFGDERNKDFVFIHDKLSNNELKDLRDEIITFIKENNLDMNK
jgi:anaerobic magnesium-protoporphyrin IX monomethyl ester cyclase